MLNHIKESEQSPSKGRKMNENNEKLSDVKMSSPFLTWLENFWYHYKWHTIAAVFAVVVLTVCLVQCSRQRDYDIYVMYAGGETFSRKSEGGDIPEYTKMLGALQKHAGDYDENGEVTLSFSDLFVPSPEEQKALGDNLDFSSMREDIKTLNDRMAYSEYYVFLVSKYVYDEYHVKSDIELFAPIKKYCPEGNDFVFEGDNAVYLSSTDLYKLAPFSDLPEDTLICIRINSEVTSAFSKKKNAELYRRAQEYITALLAYEHPTEG